MIVIFLLHRSDIALTGSDIHSFGMSDIFAYANVSGPAVGIIMCYVHSENKSRERADGSEMFRFCGSAPFQRNGCNSVKCGHL